MKTIFKDPGGVVIKMTSDEDSVTIFQQVWGDGSPEDAVCIVDPDHARQIALELNRWADAREQEEG